MNELKIVGFLNLHKVGEELDNKDQAHKLHITILMLYLHNSFLGSKLFYLCS